MARDNKLFQEALKRGSAHAWNEEWNKAAEQYRLALQEFPDDVSARTYLAMALYKSGEYRQSLALYQSLWNSQPSNLTMLQRVAELQEAVGEREAAAISYGRLAEAHTRRRSPRDAFKAWQKVVELTPGNPLLWSSLIEMAVQAGTVKEIIPGYLALARDLAVQGRFQEAIQIVERAVSLDATNPLAMGLLAGIKRAMEYWWRATGLGEMVLPEDLERLIPRVQVQVAAPPPTSVEPTTPTPHEEVVHRPYPVKEDHPTITVYASNVTLSMDQSGSVSIQGQATPAAPVDRSASGLTWQEFQALASQPPAIESQASSLHDEPVPSETEEPTDAGPTQGEALREEANTEGVPVETAEEIVEPAGIDEKSTDDSAVIELEELEPDEAAAQEETEPVAVDEPEALGIEASEGPEYAEAPVDDREMAETVPQVAVPAEEEPTVGSEEEGPAVIALEEETEPAAENREQVSVADESEVEAVVEQETAVENAVDEDRDHAASGASPDAAEAVVEEQEADEEAAAPRWKELMQEAEAARDSGELLKAADLYEQSLAAGAEETQQFVGLGEVQEQLGRLDQAAHAFAQALELSAELPQALLGLARIDLLNHKLDSAEQEARRALMGTSQATDAEASAVELLLEVLRERAAYGDLGGTAEGLAWLQSSPVADHLPIPIAKRIAQVSLTLLGRSVAEHLDEIVALPKQVRGDVAFALSKADKQIEERRLRSAADEMYRLVSLHPDFLPAQSVLGKVLLAQGRLDEASIRARRLLELYELRGRQTGSLEVLLWTVRAGIGTPEETERLEELLQTRNRAEEMEAIRLELSASQDEVASTEPDAEEGSVVEAIPEGTDVSQSNGTDGDGLLRLAESKFASGDVEEAIGLIESALRDVDTNDAATAAALLRVLQMVDPSPDGHRDALVEMLQELGLPKDLANL